MNEENMLSQQEIDALLNEDSTGDDVAGENELTGFEMDTLGEIGNITFGSASTALSTILGHKVEITTPEVELVKADELNVTFPKPHVAVSVKYTEGFSGTNLLVLKTNDAAIIADLMMGGEGQVEDDQLSELHTSAVQEAMNQMMGSAATSMSTIFDQLVNISPPSVDVIDFAESNKPQHELEEDKLVKIAFRLTVGELIDSYIMQLLPFSFAKEMTRKLTAQQEHETQEETAASTVDEVSPATQESAHDETRERDVEPSSHSQTDHSPLDRDAQVEQRQVHAAEFSPLTDRRMDGNAPDFGLFMDIPLQVTVELGRTEKSLEDLLALSPGSVIELDKLAGEPVDILVNRKRIARGEVVVVDENFGVRVTEIISKDVRFDKLR